MVYGVPEKQDGTFNSLYGIHTSIFYANPLGLLSIPFMGYIVDTEHLQML